MRKPTIAIVLLLMLAIPFQGFAAAVMQSSCALGHHRIAPGASEPHAQVEQHDHTEAHAQVVQHDHAKAHPDVSTHSESGVEVECKCGACGLGTGFPVNRKETEPGLQHTAPLERFIDLPVAMITGGPERPPRSLLA